MDLRNTVLFLEKRLWWQITFLLFLLPPPPSFLCAGSFFLKLLSSIFPLFLLTFSSPPPPLSPCLSFFLWRTKIYFNSFLCWGSTWHILPEPTEQLHVLWAAGSLASQNSSPAARQACSYLCLLCGSMWAEAIDCGFGNSEEDRITALFTWSSWWMHREPCLVLCCFHCLFQLVWHHSYILWK